MLMNLALATLNILSLIDKLYYYYYYCCCFAMHVFAMGLVVLGVSGIKPAREGILGTLAGVSSKQPIWDRGALLSVPLLLRFSEPRCWGFTCAWRT
jgi:hypothetical protein